MRLVFRWAVFVSCALGSFGFVRALPPTVTLTQVTPDENGVVIGWQSSSPELLSTLESRDSLGSENWLPVPGLEWPVRTHVVRDPRPLGAERYYRIHFQPAPAERGKLLSATSVAVLTAPQIQLLFNIAGYPITADKDVQYYKLIYETVDAQGLRTTGSGAVAVPVGATHPLPLVSYQHGTILEREDVPSRLNTEGFLGVAFATSGYVAALPDYVGLGDSPGRHPYHHAPSEATAVIDLLRAARSFCASNQIALNPQLFLTGYSQGGHATLAALREIETRHATEFPVTACASGAGAYDLSTTTANDFLSGRPQPNPYYFVYLLAAYQDIYGIGRSLADFLAEPYASRVAPLLDGTHGSGDVNAVLPADPTLALKPEVRAAFLSDSNHPLRLALRRNDLLDWAPKAPLRLYHCAGDRDVAFANSVVARDAFAVRGVTVPLLDPLPTADHGGCVEPALLGIKQWFDSLR